MKDRIFESKENYLETILILYNRNGSVRSVDIAAEMEFSKPSVSIAMKNLREEGCVTVDDSGYITLTKSGRAVHGMAHVARSSRGDSRRGRLQDRARS